MLQFNGLGHINIVVDDIEKASQFYQDVFGAKKSQEFPHFKNSGFAKSAGFLEHPEKVDVSIQFLDIPHTGVFLELFCYHSPQGNQKINYFRTNDLGGVRHVCLRVKNIDQAFLLVKNYPGIKLINSAPEYKPYKIDAITPDEFKFFDEKLERDPAAKAEVCNIIGNIRYFYFIDPYGVQWEFEEGHDDIGH